MTDVRAGHWMQTISGKKFYPLDPRPEDFTIEDIAHALSFVCRFGGHCRDFYSVAEHSRRVAHAIWVETGDPQQAMCGLLHDAAEAYIGDMVWPLKQAEALKSYKAIENAIEVMIAMRFKLPHPLPPIVKKYDLVLLSTEKRDLMGENDGVGRQASALEANAAKEKLGEAWHSDGFDPLEEKIRVDPNPNTSFIRFLEAFYRYDLKRNP